MGQILKEEPHEKLKKLQSEQKKFNRSETFGWIVGFILVVGVLYLVYWSVFVWKN